jgi:hypothetical protein
MLGVTLRVSRPSCSNQGERHGPADFGESARAIVTEMNCAERYLDPQETASDQPFTTFMN